MDMAFQCHTEMVVTLVSSQVDTSKFELFTLEVPSGKVVKDVDVCVSLLHFSSLLIHLSVVLSFCSRWFFFPSLSLFSRSSLVFAFLSLINNYLFSNFLSFFRFLSNDANVILFVPLLLFYDSFFFFNFRILLFSSLFCSFH